MKNKHEGISKIKSLSALNRFLSLHCKEIKICWKEIPKSLPESPEEALLFRQIALEIEGFRDEKLKAQWQNYWLGCCLSDSCDYIFSVLKECHLDREDDIMKLWDRGILWEYLGSKYGKNYYFDKCMGFLLRRYACNRACNLRKEYRKPLNWRNILVGLNFLILPRLIGAILIGFIPLVMADEVWQFPSKLFLHSQSSYWLLIILLLGGSYLYLFIECRNTIGKVGKIILLRTLPVFIYGLIWSFIFSCVASWLLMPYIPTKEITCAMQKCSTTVLFAVVALFIGIFLQVFWEEKTITEPL